MRKKVFFRVFCFTALAVIATVVLITLALTVAHGDTGALTGAIIRKELPYVLGILAAVLGASVPVSYAITGAIIQPLEQLGEHIDHIDRVQTEKELRPFVEKIRANNEKKRQLEKQKKQFTANVSHELKTPLTSIAGYAELIENGMARPEDIKPFAHTIRKQAQRLVSLAEDIIQLSQLEENDGEILFEEVNLTELASDCVQSLQINAQSRTVDLHLATPEAPIYIKGNKSLLEELRVAFLLHRLHASRQAPTGYDILKMATRGSARLLGRDDIGQLSVGKCADLFMIDSRRLELVGCDQDAGSVLGTVGVRGPVDYTVVQGRVTVRQGHLVTVDEELVAREANNKCRDYLANV